MREKWSGGRNKNSALLFILSIMRGLMGFEFNDLLQGAVTPRYKLA